MMRSGFRSGRQRMRDELVMRGQLCCSIKRGICGSTVLQSAVREPGDLPNPRVAGERAGRKWNNPGQHCSSQIEVERGYATPVKILRPGKLATEQLDPQLLLGCHTRWITSRLRAVE